LAIYFSLCSTNENTDRRFEQMNGRDSSDLFTGVTMVPSFSRCTLVAFLFCSTLLTAQSSQDQKSRAKDREILHEAQEILVHEHALDGMSIIPSVNHGVLTLNGFVSSQAAKVLASTEVQNIDGIRTVVNNLNVVGGSPRPASPAASGMAASPIQAGFTGTKTLTIPAGTNLAVRVTDEINTKTAKANDSFHGTLISGIRENGYEAMPAGTPVLGRVIEAKSAGHFTGTALLSVELIGIKIGTPAGPQNIRVATQELSSKAAGRGANTAGKAGGGAALGAIIGAVAGGGRGAAIGAASGGALGAGSNAMGRGQEIDIKPERLLQFKTAAPIDVQITLRNGRQLPLMAVPDTALAARPADTASQHKPE
jgi:hypothetical protein